MKERAIQRIEELLVSLKEENCLSMTASNIVIEIQNVLKKNHAQLSTGHSETPNSHNRSVDRFSTEVEVLPFSLSPIHHAPEIKVEDDDLICDEKVEDQHFLGQKMGTGLTKQNFQPIPELPGEEESFIKPVKPKRKRFDYLSWLDDPEIRAN